MRWQKRKLRIVEGAESRTLSFQVGRGNRKDIALYENLYSTVGTALPDDSPVLVTDLRTYCKIVCFTDELRDGELQGVVTMNDGTYGKAGQFVPPHRTAPLDEHLNALDAFMDCDPAITDRIAHEVGVLNRPLSISYNPAEVGENLDVSDRQTESDYQALLVATPGEN